MPNGILVAIKTREKSLKTCHPIVHPREQCEKVTNFPLPPIIFENRTYILKEREYLLADRRLKSEISPSWRFFQNVCILAYRAM